MNKSYKGSFVVDVAASRVLEAIELERLLARLPGVTAVSVTDPYAQDPDDPSRLDPHPQSAQDEEN
jgi:hypothetical protein